MSTRDLQDARPDPVGGPFRIATVAEITGVPEPTLRAWERRYGVPSPERTASGYRLYGPAEVDEVRSMRTLCEDGMAAAEAAKLVLARRGAQATHDLGHAPLALDADVFDATIDALVDSVARFDVADFEDQIRRLPLLGSTMTVLDRVVTPVLREIGKRWHDGELSIAQERMASQRFSTFLRDMLRLVEPEAGEDRAVLACFADEEHELGLLGTAVRLASWGIRPVYLGGRMPPSALRTAVDAVSPMLVGLSVTLPPPRARARELAEAYASACEGVPWIVGGKGAPPVADLIEKFGGRVVAEEADALREVVNSVRRGASTRPHAKRGGSK